MIKRSSIILIIGITLSILMYSFINVEAAVPINEAGWPYIDTITNDGFTLRVKTNLDGNSYYVVVPYKATSPTSAQVQAGHNSSNVQALSYGSFPLTANTEATQNISGLDFSTAYDVYVVSENGVDLQATPTKYSVVKSSNSFPAHNIINYDSTLDKYDLSLELDDVETFDGVVEYVKEDLSTMEVKINGLTQGNIDTSNSTVNNIPNQVFASTDNPGIGAVNGTNAAGEADSQNFRGILDEIRIYERALDDDEHLVLSKYGDFTTGLVSYYKLDELAGVVATDETGFSNGTLNNFEVDKWIPGKFDGSLEFDGSNDSIEVNNGSFLGPNYRSYTVSMWIKPNSLVGVQTILDEGDSNNGIGIRLDGNTLEFGVKYRSKALMKRTFTIDTNWNHIAVVFSFNDSEWSPFEIYHNGSRKVRILTGYPDEVGAAYLENTSIGVTTGTDVFGGGAGNNFNGFMDDFRIFNVAKTAQDISCLYHIGEYSLADVVSNLSAHYSFDDAVGNILTEGVSGNNGLMTNFEADRWTTGVVNSALEFDGINDWVNIENGAFLKNGFTDFTVGFWISPYTLRRKQEILDIGGDVNGLSIRLNDSNLEVNLRSNGLVKNVSGKAYAGWQHYSITFDGVGKFIKLYRNGQLVNTTPASLDIDIYGAKAIASKAELLAADINTNFDKYYILIDDIDIGSGWTSLCPATAFSGILDGNNKKITNLDNSFFRLVTGKISNVVIESPNINIPIPLVDPNDPIAALIIDGRANTVIYNCHVNGGTITSKYPAGLIGFIEDGTVKHSSSSANINATVDKAAGFASESNRTTFESCFVKGNVTSVAKASGFIHKTQESNFMSCYVEGIVNAGTDSGGFSYFIFDGVYVANCYVDGEIIGNRAGGFGYIIGASGTIVNSFVTGSVNTTNDGSGFVGDDYKYNYIDCYFSGEVRSDNKASGFIGFSNVGNFYNCYSEGTVIGDVEAGGFAHYTMDAKTYKCFTKSTVISDGKAAGFIVFSEGDYYHLGSYVVSDVYGKFGAGYVGEYTNSGGNFYKTFFSGSVLADNVVGYAENDGGWTIAANIYEAFVDAKLVGRIVQGFGYEGSFTTDVKDVFVKGTIKALEEATAFIHTFGYTDAEIQRALFIGEMQAPNKYGIMAQPKTGQEGIIVDTFFDKTKNPDILSGAYIDYFAGKTTTELQQQATYTNYDFTNTWIIDEGNDYPYLRNMTKTSPIAKDDRYYVASNTSLSVTGEGVLENDYWNLDVNSASAIKVSDPANGSVVFYSNGNFVYTPNVGFKGQDSFTYRLYDGSNNGNTATVNIWVNIPPELDDSVSPKLDWIEMNILDVANVGNTVGEIVVDGSITDSDVVGTAPESIAIISRDDTNGEWQYQLNGSSNWVSMYALLRDDAAIVLDADDKVRFVPDADWTGISTFEFKAWDKDFGDELRMDYYTYVNGGSYSSKSDIASILVPGAPTVEKIGDGTEDVVIKPSPSSIVLDFDSPISVAGKINVVNAITAGAGGTIGTTIWSNGDTTLTINGQVGVDTIFVSDVFANVESTYGTTDSNLLLIDSSEGSISITDAVLNYGTGELIVNFDSNINPQLINQSLFHINNTTGIDNITLTDKYTSCTNKSVTFTLTQKQRIDAIAISGIVGGDAGAVVLDVDAGAITSLDGNINLIDDNNMVTEIADTILPTENKIFHDVLRITPANANIFISFDEPVIATATASQIIIKNLDTSTVLYNIAANDARVQISGSQVVINIKDDGLLTASQKHKIYIGGSAFTDYANNSFAGIDNYYFTPLAVADATSPAVSLYTPLDNSSGIDINSDFTITFNEVVQAVNAKNIVLKKYENGDVVETINAGDINKVTVDGYNAIINPTTILDPLTMYYIEYDVGAFVDRYDNQCIAVTDKDIWNFTTAEINSPTIAGLFPSNGADEISIDTDFRLTFNEMVSSVAGKFIEIRRYSDYALIERIDASDSRVVINNGTVTINPNSNIEGLNQYYVNIDQGAFVDQFSNPFFGMYGKETWKVQDIIAPTITSITQIDGSTLKVKFSEEVDLVTSQDINNYTINNNFVIQSVTRGGTGFEDEVYLTISNPNSFFEAQADISVAAVKDTSGNLLIGVSTSSLNIIGNARFSSTSSSIINVVEEDEIYNTDNNVMGVVNGGVYKDKVDIIVKSGLPYLNGKLMENIFSVTKSGIHKLVIKYNGESVETIYFTIDNTPPEIYGVEDGKSYNHDISIGFSDGFAKVNDEAYLEGTFITKEGKYKVEVESASGILNHLEFEIDKTSPKISGVGEGKTYYEPVKIRFNEGKATINGNNFVSGTSIASVGKQQLKVEDKAGNITIVNFEIQGITLEKLLEHIKLNPEKIEYYKDLAELMKNEGKLDSIKVIVNGKIIDFSDYGNVNPIIIKNKILVPVRAVAEELGFNITRDGIKIDMNVPHIVLEGITLVPIRFISEIFNTQVHWESAGEGRGIVCIYSSNKNNEIKDDEIDDEELLIPTIQGVKNNGFYNHDVHVNVNFENFYLNGTKEGQKLSRGILKVELNNEKFIGGNIELEGRYELVASVIGGSTIKVIFIIDKTPPEVTGVEDGFIYEEEVTIYFDESIGMINGKYISSGKKIKEPGMYHLFVADKANNITKVRFRINKKAEDVLDIMDSEKQKFGEVKISKYSDAVLKIFINGKEIFEDMTITEEGLYEIKVIYVDGSEKTSVIEIDKTPPEFKGVENGGIYNHPVSIEFDEGKSLLNGEVYESGQKIKKENQYQLYLNDSYGNYTSVEFKIDLTPPNIVGVEDGKVYDEILEVFCDEGVLLINRRELRDSIISEPGEYKVTATDEAGNTKVVNFTLNELNLNKLLEKIKQDKHNKKLYQIAQDVLSKHGYNGILIFADGNLVNYSSYNDVKPIIQSGRTLVPIRAIMETLKADVKWVDETKEVNIHLDDIHIRLGINSKEVIVNNDLVTIDVVPTIIDGRSVLPLRFISENLGYNVDWYDLGKNVRFISLTK